MTIAFALVACNKQQSTEEKTTDKKVEDLIFVSDKDNSFGYYKSSIVKVNNNLHVWLHMPKANQSSTKEIERLSKLLIEISCDTHELKLLKATDTLGKELSLTSNEKWDNPSPASDFYQVIIKVCDSIK